MTALLEVVGLGKRFAGRNSALSVIDGMSFVVNDGEFVTMVGPSGAGKSTLLDIIAQIERPTSGSIRLRGEEILSPATSMLEPGWRCQIGYVTQREDLLPWRTAIDNVLFPLRAQGRLDAATERRALELMEIVGLKGFERYYPNELSGGMRKRVALIRTLAYDPPVILMDEPFGALDSQTRAQLHAELLQLWSTKRKTILFVTHDIAEAVALGDRVLVLSRAPARIQSEHAVPLPRPRQIDSLATEPEFLHLFRRIRKELA
jgi:NitT/TauT family transport system ATP-binding protein